MPPGHEGDPEGMQDETEVTPHGRLADVYQVVDELPTATLSARVTGTLFLPCPDGVRLLRFTKDLEETRVIS